MGRDLKKRIFTSESARKEQEIWKDACRMCLYGYIYIYRYYTTLGRNTIINSYNFYIFFSYMFTFTYISVQIKLICYGS